MAAAAAGSSVSVPAWWVRAWRVAERFLCEVRAARVVAAHPGIVKVLEAGQREDGTLFMIMEYLSGRTLRERLGEGALAPDRVVRLGWQMAVAVAAAHKKDIVHRDLKPENVMLVPDAGVAGGLRVKILDFGIAKLGLKHGLRRYQTKPGALMGTLSYMAPEQVLDAAGVSAKADVHALGVIWYEMLTGRWLAERPPLLAPCPAPLSQLVQEMMAAAPAQRPGLSQVVRKLGADRLDLLSG